MLSHGLKESLVRSVPINQGKFNLNISVAQLIAGIILSPILLAISYKYDNYTEDSPLGKLQTNQAPFSEFYFKYIELGFGCAFNIEDNGTTYDDGGVSDVCQYTMLPLFFYVISIFGLQLSIQTLMVNKATLNARMIFAWMVPLTTVAFLCGAVSTASIRDLNVDLTP